MLSASCCRRCTSLSPNRPGSMAAAASTPVTRPSTMNGTVATEGALRSSTAGLIPAVPRTVRLPSSSATSAYPASAATITRAEATH